MGKNKGTLKPVALVLVLMLVLAGCSNAADTGGKGTESETAVEKFTIAGLDGGEVDVTIEELKSMESVTMDAVAIDSAGNKTNYSVTGPLLADLLVKYDKRQSQLFAIRLIAGDGYSIEVPGEVLKARDVILAHTINGKPLEDKDKPLRIIIPDERAMYWVRNLARIEILGESSELATQNIYFLETKISCVPSEEYTYYESLDRAVKVNDLTGSTEDKTVNTVFMKAADGFEKNEQTEIFKSGYIKYTGEDAPVFLSPDIPKGMYVKNILWFSYGENAFVSAGKSAEVFEKRKAGDKEGISIADLFAETGMAEAGMYRFTASDGYSVEVAAEDISKGIVYADNSGHVRTCFDGLPKNTTVKGLLSISAVE